MCDKCLQILLCHILAPKMGQPSESTQVNGSAMLHYHVLVVYRLLEACSPSLGTGLQWPRRLILDFLRVKRVDIRIRIRHNAKLTEVVRIELQVVTFDVFCEEPSQVNTQGHQSLLQLARL